MFENLLFERLVQELATIYRSVAGRPGSRQAVGAGYAAAGLSLSAGYADSVGHPTHSVTGAAGPPLKKVLDHRLGENILGAPSGERIQSVRRQWRNSFSRGKKPLWRTQS